MQQTLESLYKRFDTNAWVQVYEFGPQDSEIDESKGKLICCVSIEVNDPDNLIEPGSFGKKALSILHHVYYSEVSQSAFSSLLKAMELVKRDIAGDKVRINMSCLACVGKTAYVGVLGKAKVSILRSGGFADILLGSENVTTASGFPKLSDVMFLSVGGAINMENTQVAKIFNDQTFSESTLEIEKILNKESETYGLGLIKFGATEDTYSDIQGLDQNSIKSDTSNRFFGKFDRFRINFNHRRLRVQGAEEEIPKQKKSILTVGVLIIILLVVSIVFGVIQKNQKESVAKYEDRLNQAVSDYEQSISLYGVSTGESRERFTSSKRLADELTAEGVADERLQVLVNDLTQNEGKILGTYQTLAELFVDLSLLSENFVGMDMSSDELSVFVLSDSGDRVAQVNFDSKRSEVIFGPDDISSAQRVANFEENVFYINEEGLFESGKDEIQEKYWGSDALLQSYSGNIYLLDKSQSKIFRHNISDSGYTDANEWTQEGAERDFSMINAWTIDGFIWLLSDTGRIVKYSGGVQQNFSVNGLSPDLQNPIDIYTDENSDFIYVLDPSNSRIVVVDKESGEFISSYANPDLSGASQIAVSEENGLLLVLSGNKLKSIGLGHLDN